MAFIINVLKFIIICVLAIFYWPLNTFFLWFQGFYFDWKKTDRVSFWIATPLYYLLFLITALLSFPLEVMGMNQRPSLPGFK